MCTVTFVPADEDGFLLTSNRDESPDRRAASWQETDTRTGERIWYPQDPLKGGTWFCVSDRGRTACLLNGAFEPFLQDPAYVRSRGEVVLDYFHHLHTRKWIEGLDLSVVAPFTLLLFDGVELNELIWDGKHKHIRDLDLTEAQIWSSVTLYPREVREWRASCFEDWRKENKNPTQADMMQFHRFGGKGDPENDFVMDRDIVKTLSVTSIACRREEATLKYRNLDTGKEMTRQFHFHPISSQT